MSHPNPEDKIEGISSTEGAKGVSKTQQTEEPAERTAPNKEKFDSLIQPTDKAQNVQAAAEASKKQVAKTEAADATKKVANTSGTSLMDEMRNLNAKVNNATATPETLAHQSKEIVTQMNELKQKLSTPHLELSPATQKVLENKLYHIDESLKAAMSKAGVEYASPKELTASNAHNPIERFLGYLTGAQSQMDGLSEQVKGLGPNLSASDMFRMQMSLSTVTVQIEFFSSTLNKALESIKTVMQVQV